MKIYKINCQDGFQWLLPEDENDNAFLRFDCQPLAPTWGSLRMKHVLRVDENGSLLQPSDLPCGGGGWLMMLNQTAKQMIGSLLERYGELLPLVAENDEPYWAFNVTRIVDALDESQSQFLRASKDGHIILVKNPIFKPELLAGEQIFKVPQSLRGPIYVTDEFVETIKLSGLTGVEFRTVWELRAN